MNKRWMRKLGGFLFVLVCVLLAAGVPASAATVQSDAEILRIMNLAFANGDLEVNITVERTFATSEYQAKAEAEAYASELMVLLEEAALNNGKLMNGTSYSYVIVDNRLITYKFDISAQNMKSVKVLTSEKSAYKQALRALKNCDYTTNFYSEDGMYYGTFVLALQHHPEYNYNVVIWKATDGTFGYRPGGELTASKIKTKMSKTDAKANAIIKRIITAGMTNKQKLQAIHDYLVKYCVYDESASGSGYDDAFTAYGCLVKGSAVCQGYAGAFNLLATKAGICSIAVGGEAGGGSHAWNFVKNGSTYRYIDATWDDPLPDRGSKASVPHKYFYVTQAQLALNHTWDKTEYAKKYVKYAKVLQ